MKLNNLLFLVATVLISIPIATTICFAGRQYGYGFQLIGKDALGITDTIYCGYVPGYGNATYCVDADTFDLPEYGVSVLETRMPPMLYPQVFEFRFIDPLDSYPCLDDGIHNNFHKAPDFEPDFPSNHPNRSLTKNNGNTIKHLFGIMIDTFTVYFNSSVRVNSTHSFLISWKLTNYFNMYIESCELEYYAPALRAVDMMTQDSVRFYRSSTNSFDIIVTFYGVLGAGERDGNNPIIYALNQNYPNPFNPSTIINYTLPVSSIVSLKIYNLLGQEVTTLVDHMQHAGEQSIEWDATNVPGGVYLYRLTTSSGFTSTKKMILLK